MDHKYIRFIGRHIKKNNYNYFSYSGCGFEFVVAPHRLICTVKLSLVSETREHDYQFVEILINEVSYLKKSLPSGENEVEIFLPNNSKNTVIKVLKLNETYLSSIYLKDLTINQGQFAVIEPSKKKLIGFFGDSITCGYGLSDFHGEDFTMESEDFTKTYAYIASFNLNMDYTVVARSGISIALPIFVDRLFNEIYDTVDMYEKCKDDRKLDYAVINLITNDNSAYYQEIDEKDRPSALDTIFYSYIKLVENIIGDNPNVKIVMCYNMLKIELIMIDTLFRIFEYVKTHFDNPCQLVEFVPNSEGASQHPYQTAHEENARILVNAIRSF